MMCMQEVYDDETGQWVPIGPEESDLGPVPVLFEEVYDDETGTWIEEETGEEWLRPASLDLLKGPEAPLSRDEAFTLCATAILNGSSSRDFEAVLDLCPSLPNFLNIKTVAYSIPDVWSYPGLVELAAYLGRANLLDSLLRRGGNVNVRPAPSAPGTLPISPLEAAVYGGSLECVERLLDEPTLGLSFSTQLQRLWAKPALDSDQRRCLQRIAPQVAGMAFPDHGPVPIPEKFLPAVAIEMGNGELFLRLCRERGKLTLSEAESALDTLWVSASLMHRADPPDMLLALLDLFPEAIERQEGRALLALSGGNYPQDTRLEPWLEQLRSKSIPLELLDEHFAGWEKAGVNTRRLRTRMGIA